MNLKFFVEDRNDITESLTIDFVPYENSKYPEESVLLTKLNFDTMHPVTSEARVAGYGPSHDAPLKKQLMSSLFGSILERQ